ncbi:2Fe-2S iron-sulfur cluster-binding protein [Streptomyces sp. ICBB 8177]|uniref:(2Fe-2S)-binding protein n=1 Tax=Streptomyces sp. ICBB 8177 TaxID=563922 RepID=UPI000D67D1B7|nr:2Fe-2S iron-sulfur cluster-binding protein [Streptomyces sp. ICBB 8177]PWI42893.1 (2Fe-2S)-binding protein [Streptomyces sp. ICBB 8177]
MDGTSRVGLRINGEPFSRVIDNRTTLLDLLREQAGVTGPKKGCDHGQCGACTVLLDGDRRVNACLLLAVSLDGADVTTVEGLADGDRLHPVQQAFVDHDGFQCGFCTPGQICSAVAAIAEARAGWPSVVTPPDTPPGPVEPTAPEIRERMSGNLCRCGAYVNIVAAVREVAR